MDVSQFVSAGKGLDQGVEGFELVVCELAILVGGGKVGTKSGDLDSGEGPDGLQGRWCVAWEKATPSHPGVHREVGFHNGASMAGKFVKVACFFHGIEAGQPALSHYLFPFGGEGSSQEVDWRPDPGL